MPYGRFFAPIYNKKWGDFEKNTTPFLLRTVKSEFPGAESWLDLCCGTGFLLKRVSRRFFNGWGVDRSPYQIYFARRNAPKARLIIADIRYLVFRRRFDILSCMFDSLNYITRKTDLEDFFRNVRSWMHEQSLFFFDMNTYEGLEDRWNSTRTIKGKKYRLVMENTFQRTSGRAVCFMKGAVKDGKQWRPFEERHEERGYRNEEIDSALKKAGYIVIKKDGETLKDPVERSPRLLYICRRSTKIRQIGADAG